MKNWEKEMEERIRRFRPIDDVFFEVLADDKDFCEEILRVILQDDKLQVISVYVQKSVRNLVGRSVRVDAFCILGDGTRANIEVQRSDNDNHLRRMRYNSSCITASVTEPGERFENVPDVTVVYISEFDLFKGNYTTYHVINILAENGEIVDSGLHMICVNAKVNDGSEIAELMQCFMQTEVNNDKFEVFTRRMNYLKHSERGRRYMCQIMDELLEEYAEEMKDNQIRRALDKGRSIDVIADCIDVPVDRVLEVRDRSMSLV
jgi:predicted transposase/invertase (TIGR01784 family)